jgi:hypothetical protein
MEHDLYEDCDRDIPAVICDSNGQVVLAMCKRCELAESDLLDVSLCPGYSLHRARDLIREIIADTNWNSAPDKMEKCIEAKGLLINAVKKLSA